MVFFAFGIDRDRKFDVVITKETNGKKEKIIKKVQKREYKIQKIDLVQPLLLFHQA